MTWRSVVFGAALLAACSEPIARRGDGLDAERLPESVRADYAVFAQKCSKCHTLARPLNSGIEDNEHWDRYVARMRRQPSSGISEEDTRPILRFLYYYSLERRRAKSERDGAP